MRACVNMCVSVRAGGNAAVSGHAVAFQTNIQTPVYNLEAGDFAVETPPHDTRGLKNKIKQNVGRRQKWLQHLPLYIPSVQNKREKPALFSSPNTSPELRGAAQSCGTSGRPLPTRAGGNAGRHHGEPTPPGALGGRGQEKSVQWLGSPAVCRPLLGCCRPAPDSLPCP